MAGTAKALDVDAAVRWLGDTGGKLSSFAVPLKRAALVLKADLQENFRAQRSPGGASWAPLKHPRIRGGGGAQALRDTGILMASVTATSAKGHVESVSETELVLGTNLEYARIHQEGGVITPKRAKFLAIPVTRAAFYAGSPRRFKEPLVAVMGKRGGVLKLKALPVGKNKKQYTSDNKWLGKDLVQYILVKSVTIPARPFVGVSAEALNDVILTFADWAQEELAK